MSKDIRSFFTVLSKKPAGTSSPVAKSPVKKKSKRLIDSDDDDVVEATPEAKIPKKPQSRTAAVIISDSKNDTKKSQVKERNSNSKKRRIVISSDSEDDKPKNKPKQKVSEAKPQLKAVDIKDMFGSTPIKQSKVEVLPKKKSPTVEEVKKSKKSNKKKTELGIHNDEKFEQTLKALDEDDDLFSSFVNDDLFSKEAQELLAKQKEEQRHRKNNEEKKETIVDNNQSKKEREDSKEVQSEKSQRKRSRTDLPSPDSTVTPKKKKKAEYTDSPMDPQEAFEKRRSMYQNYLNRSGPKNQGLKELPHGKPDCLSNLCFLRTGVLDSLTGEDFESLVKQHGGRVVHSVSKKVNYVVVGEEAGPSKLQKAKNYNIPQISEDELLDMILKKSGMVPKYVAKENLEDSIINTNIENGKKHIAESPKKSTKKEKSARNGETSPEKAETSSAELRKKKLAKDDSKSSVPVNESKKLSQKVASLNGVTKTEDLSQKSSVTKVDGLPQLQSTNQTLSLVDKYKPTNIQGIIGQQQDGSNLHRLKQWLQNWQKNQDPKIKKTLSRPSPWAKKDDGAYFKCVLLSGPPGIGKTTTATLVAKELKLDVVEFNASDTRSKKLLNLEVKSLLSSNTISGFAAGQNVVNKNRVLLMDEVDGMAGNEDRGGIQELIQLIKHTSIPIICMCNDRNHQKMRSLVNYCYDLKFTPPRPEQLKGAMMSVCCRENIDITMQALSEIIARTKGDIRQTLNDLALLKTGGKEISVEDAKQGCKKDSVMGPWDVCKTVFTKSEHKNMSVADRARLFFYDYSLGPLFVQENYIKVQPSDCPKKKWLLRAALSADAISMGDMIDSKIRRENNWSLLESQAFFSSVLPGYYMSGTFQGMINFPGWLGKNSKKNKFRRLISEIQTHTRMSTCASQLGVKLDYLVPLRNAVVSPLQKGLDGVREAVEFMKDYNLLREDVDSLIELCQWARGENPFKNVETKVKTAFTKSYNQHVVLPYASNGVSSKRKAAAETDIMGEDEEESGESEKEDNDLSKNTMIKVKQRSTKTKTNRNESAGTSKKGRSKKK